MLSGYVVDIGPSLLTFIVWAAMVRFLRIMNNWRYVRVVSVKIMTDRKIVKKELKIFLPNL